MLWRMGAGTAGKENWLALFMGRVAQHFCLWICLGSDISQPSCWLLLPDQTARDRVGQAACLDFSDDILSWRKVEKEKQPEQENALEKVFYSSCS